MPKGKVKQVKQEVLGTQHAKDVSDVKRTGRPDGTGAGNKGITYDLGGAGDGVNDLGDGIRPA